MIFDRKPNWILTQTMNRFLLYCMAVWILGIGEHSHAANGFSSSSSQNGEVTRFSPELIVSFSKKVERMLAEKGAHVAILARMGRPPSDLPQGMYYTHTGFAVYSEGS